jgi:hypothetical protein
LKRGRPSSPFSRRWCATCHSSTSCSKEAK